MGLQNLNQANLADRLLPYIESAEPAFSLSKPGELDHTDSAVEISHPELQRLLSDEEMSRPILLLGGRLAEPSSINPGLLDWGILFVMQPGIVQTSFRMKLAERSLQELSLTLNGNLIESRNGRPIFTPLLDFQGNWLNTAKIQVKSNLEQEYQQTLTARNDVTFSLELPMPENRPIARGAVLDLEGIDLTVMLSASFLLDFRKESRKFFQPNFLVRVVINNTRFTLLVSGADHMEDLRKFGNYMLEMKLINRLLYGMETLVDAGFAALSTLLSGAQHLVDGIETGLLSPGNAEKLPDSEKIVHTEDRGAGPTQLTLDL